MDHPDAVEGLHREFLRAGSDIIEAFTYCKILVCGATYNPFVDTRPVC